MQTVKRDEFELLVRLVSIVLMTGVFTGMHLTLKHVLARVLLTYKDTYFDKP